MIISIAHQKGGVGKSTIAINLAVLLSEKYGDAFRVIDLDVQRSVSYFNGIRRGEGMEPLPIIKVESKQELKEALKDDSGITIIDIGGFDSDVNRLAMLYSDLVLTPVADSPLELGGLLKFRGILRDLRKARPDLVATVILNNVHQFASRSLDEIFEFCRKEPEFDIFTSMIRNRADFKKSIDKGQSAGEFKPGCKAYEEIKKLEKEIYEKI